MSDITDQLAIGADAANRLFFSARTANEFSSEPVPDQTLAAIYETMKMGPTLMNSQPLRITWIKSSEAREAVAATMKGSNARKALEAPALAATASRASADLIQVMRSGWLFIMVGPIFMVS